MVAAGEKGALSVWDASGRQLAQTPEQPVEPGQLGGELAAGD